MHADGTRHGVTCPNGVAASLLEAVRAAVTDAGAERWTTSSPRAEHLLGRAPVQRPGADAPKMKRRRETEL